ncbi:hypothetical protein [Tahibacter amnicola]|uniref:Uncharacterized protein n=1 Tax=Tahibacter amnicola TaxID=2976241 RepID=A0ABY6BBF0_9GAMM|nr:hypothetical protein [Tahibacter amnicola]UXI67029.1 hypothetical protein N4264_20085 [Tahibacter amnicola]
MSHRWIPYGTSVAASILLTFADMGNAHAETRYWPESLGTLATVPLAVPAGSTTLTTRVAHALDHPVATAFRMNRAVTRSYSLPADPTPGNAFDIGAGGEGFFLHPLADSSGTRTGYAEVSVVAPRGTSEQDRFAVIVGLDLDRDGQPSADELRCTARNTAGQARCRLDVRDHGTDGLWVITQAPTSPVASTLETTLDVARFDLSNGKIRAIDSIAGSLAVATPETVDANSPFVATLIHGARPPVDTYGEFAGLLFTAVDATAASATLVPIALQPVHAASSTQPVAISPYKFSPNEPVMVTLAPGQAQERLYVDNPSQNEMSVSVDTLDGVEFHSASSARSRPAVHLAAPLQGQVVTPVDIGRGTRDLHCL